MARTLLSILPMVPLGACLLPPQLERGVTDSGLNSTPYIIDVSPAAFAFPGAPNPILIQRGEKEMRFFNLTLSDENINDVLFVRMFVDYTAEAPTPPVVPVCSAASTGMIERVADCPANLICGVIDGNDATPHKLEAMVADREFITKRPGQPDAATPQQLYRTLPTDAASSIRGWAFTCEPESS